MKSSGGLPVSRYAAEHRARVRVAVGEERLPAHRVGARPGRSRARRCENVAATRRSSRRPGRRSGSRRRACPGWRGRRRSRRSARRGPASGAQRFALVTSRSGSSSVGSPNTTPGVLRVRYDSTIRAVASAGGRVLVEHGRVDAAVEGEAERDLDAAHRPARLRRTASRWRGRAGGARSSQSGSSARSNQPASQSSASAGHGLAGAGSTCAARDRGPRSRSRCPRRSRGSGRGTSPTPRPRGRRRAGSGSRYEKRGYQARSARTRGDGAAVADQLELHLQVAALRAPGRAARAVW